MHDSGAGREGGPHLLDWSSSPQCLLEDIAGLFPVSPLLPADCLVWLLSPKDEPLQSLQQKKKLEIKEIVSLHYFETISRQVSKSQNYKRLFLTLIHWN